MADARQREMTVEEFLQWNLLQDQRYELVDGHPVALRPAQMMAGARSQHDIIVVNLIASLRQQLRTGPCMPRSADTAVRTKIKSVRRPDVTIECAPPERNALEANNPVAVFEVLSPTTRQLDRSIKLQEYRRHPSLRTIVHVDPETMDVVVYSRTPSGDWEDARLDQPTQAIEIVEPAVAISLAEVYADVPLSPPSANNNRPPDATA